MDKTYTTSLLGLLEKPELTALGKFLKSPFFTAKDFLHRLFLELREAEPRATLPAEAIFARVFPEESFDDGHKWNKALSDLNACIEEFLIVRQTLDDPHLRIQAEVGALFGRRDENLFRRKIGAALKNLPGNGAPETTEGWQLRFRMLKAAVSYPLTDRMKNLESAYENLEESLETYYFISKLQLACNRASHAQLVRLENDEAYFRQLLDQTKRFARSGESALITLYHALLHLLTAPAAQFSSFFKLLQKQGPRLERSEKESVARFAFNFCIHRYREGETNAFGWYRQVFDWADGQKVWTAEAVEEVFLNTGVMFAKSGDIRGFDAFLEKSKSALSDERRHDAVALLRAYRHFYQSEFGAAARLLNQQVDTRHPRYSLLYHSLKVRNTYEEWLLKQVESEELERVLNSFGDFLQRKDLFAESLRQSYHTLIWFVRKMAQHGKKRALSKMQLVEELKRKKPAVRDWLIAKIDGLPG